MKFLKGLALGILGFLLFLSLSIFGLALMLNYTALSPDFVVSQVNRLDLSSLGKEILKQQIPQEVNFITEATINEAITKLKPWIKEQVSTVTKASYDYLLGKSQSLSVSISLEPAKENLKETIKKSILQSPPAELATLPPSMIEQYFDQYYQQFSAQIPSTFDINESFLGPETMAALEQVRQYIGYFQIVYKALIGFMLLLILGIVLLHHEVRGSTRSLGITFTTYGAIEYGGILASKHFAMPQMAQLSIPTYLGEWLPQFIDDLLAPLEMFSLWVLIGGVGLLVVSFVYRRREANDETQGNNS